jgi:hypothetical protein
MQLTRTADRPRERALDEFDFARPRVIRRLARKLAVVECAFILGILLWVHACFAGGLAFLYLGMIQSSLQLMGVVICSGAALVKGYHWLDGELTRRSGALREEIRQIEAEHLALTGESCAPDPTAVSPMTGADSETAMTKPTSASVTTEPCRCGYLQRAADDPGSPVVFDSDSNEYNFRGPGSAAAEDPRFVTVRIYHCPFCGGAAPSSKPRLQFVVISQGEQQRLLQLLDGIRTLDDAIRVLGPPEEDTPHGVTETHPEEESAAPTVRSCRTLTYRGLSETADVCILDRQGDRVGVILQGKYVGGPTAAEREPP